MVKFVQGSAVELSYGQLSNSIAIGKSLTLFKDRNCSERRIGGSQAQVRSQALTYDAQPLDNATFTVQIYDATGASEATIQGSNLGLGIYGANLNLNNQSLPIGEHRITTQLYAQVPSGAVIQFDEQSLTIVPPLFLLQLIAYVVALVAVGFVLYNSSLRKAKPSRGRGEITAAS